MDGGGGGGGDTPGWNPPPVKGQPGSTVPASFPVQLAIALPLGAIAFTTFCILRRRWKAMYGSLALRKGMVSVLMGHTDKW